MKRTGRQKDIVTPEKKQEQRELLRLFSANIRKILKNTDLLADDLQEIRLRTGAPLLVVAKDQEYFLTPDGALTGEWEKGYPVSPTDIRDTMDYIGSFSLYAYEDELRQGFLTVEGGHRIGIAGKTVIEGEKVKGISHISCINVRVAHEKKGCADRVMPYLWEDGRFLHTLIVSAPGCGKTTMINLLMRFYDPDSGSISVDGTNTQTIPRRALRRNFGMVLQDTWLKAGTIYENIAMGKPEATEEEIIAAAKQAHAHSFIMRLPQGYDTVIGESGGSLSQGQKQLLCIARVMLCLPPMLFLDEATSSIDTRTEIKIQKAFDTMMRGRTSFIVAHRLSTIREADRILVMRDGHIVEQGKHEELLAKNGFYAKLYQSQFAH